MVANGTGLLLKVHAPRPGQRGDKIFRISRNSMFMQVETIPLALGRNAEKFKRLEEIHYCQRNSECGKGDRKTSDRLRFEHRQAATVKQSRQWSRRVGRYRTSRAVLATREEAQRKRTPDPRKPVDRDGADRIVNPQPVQELHTYDDNYAGNSAQDDSANRANPVAGTGDSNQPGQKAVDGEANVPFLTQNVSVGKSR